MHKWSMCCRKHGNLELIIIIYAQFIACIKVICTMNAAYYLHTLSFFFRRAITKMTVEMEVMS